MDQPDFSGFVNEFLEEAEEHLQTLNGGLLELEQGLATGTPKKEKIDTLFRAAHTIKGLAGMMEFEQIELLCHNMEDIFGGLRQGYIHFSPAIIDVLFEAVDLLSKAVDAIRERKGKKDVDISETLMRLKKALQGNQEADASPPKGPNLPSKEIPQPQLPSPSSPESESPPLPAIFSQIHFAIENYDIGSFDLDEKESAVLSDACLAGLWIYEVTKEFLGGTPSEKLERLPIFKQIEESCFLLATSPRLEQIPLTVGMVNCRILFSSEKPPNVITDDFFDPIRTVVVGEPAARATFLPFDSAGREEREAFVPMNDLTEVLKSTDESLVNEFMKKAEETMNVLDLKLMDLERDPTNQESMTEIHRHFRTLKGIATIFGFSKIAILAGKMELLFEQICSERLTATNGVFELLSAGMQRFRKLSEELEEKKDKGVKVTDLVERVINTLGQIRRKPAELDGLMKKSSIDEATLSKLSDEEKGIIADEYEKNLVIYEINIRFSENVLESGYEPISVVPVLEKIGNIIVSTPLIEGVPEIVGFEARKFKMGFRFLLSSELDTEEIRQRFEELPRFLHISIMEVMRKGMKSSFLPQSSPGTEANALQPTPLPVITSARMEPPVSKAVPDAGKGAITAEAEQKIKEKVANTIRVDIDRLDKLLNLIGELVIDRTRLDQIGSEIKKIMPHHPLTAHLTQTSQLFHRHMNEVQDMIMSVRMVPIANVFNKFPRIVRDLSKSLGKTVNLVVSGEDTELDKTLIEEIGDPLMHLIRNAIDHGIELPKERIAAKKPGIGTIHLKASHEGDTIIIEVADDGKGIDFDRIREKAVAEGLLDPNDTTVGERDLFQLIFLPGFSTAETTSLVSGRGVGMDVVKSNIMKLKGLIDVYSEKGKGTRISIRLPLTLAIVPTLIVGVLDETFAIPLSSVVESIRISPSDIRMVHGREMITMRGSVLPLVRLDEMFSLEKRRRTGKPLSPISSDLTEGAENRGRKEGRRKRNSQFVVVVGLAERRLGLVVSSLVNQQEMVIKSLGNLLKDTPCISSATIMGDGRVALILDAGQIIEEASKRDRYQTVKPTTL